MHGVHHGVPSTLAGSTAFVVAPRHAPEHMQGHQHEGLEGCGSKETPPPLVAILEHPP